MYLDCPLGDDDSDSPSGLSGLSCVGGGPNDRASMLSIDTDGRVFRMDTFSKFSAPGMRCAWITMPEPYVKHAGAAAQNSTKTGSVFSQIALFNILNEWKDEGLTAHLQKVQSYYRSRASRLDYYASKHLSGLATWTVPDCSMFFWIKVNGVDDSAKLLKMLMAEKVAIVPGKYFNPEVDPDEHYDCSSFRVAYTVATDEQFDRGMESLAKVVKEYIQTHNISVSKVETNVNRRRRVGSRMPVAQAATAP